MGTIGERVASARIARGWSQTELAEKAGTRQSTISGIETKERNKRPDLIGIAHALGVDAYWLKTGIETIIAGDARINEVVRMMKEMTDEGRAVVLDKAREMRREYPKASSGKTAA